MHFERLVNSYVRKELIPVYIEDNIFDFYKSKVKSTKKTCCEQFSAAGGRLWHSSALASPTKFLNTDLAPIGDDIEPIEAPREDVKMGSDEVEEPLEADVLRAKMIPKNPTSRKKQKHENSGHVVCMNKCAACVQGRGIGGQHRIELLEEKGTERAIPNVVLEFGVS